MGGGVEFKKPPLLSYSSVPNLPENTNREILAKALAKSQTDVNVRRLIKQKALRKFDGDYDILFSQIIKESISSTEVFSQKLEASITTMDQGFAKSGKVDPRVIEDYIQSKPMLQISIPEKAEEWDAENETALVAFIPIGIDDEKLEVIKAFDQEGKIHYLSTQEEPHFPVIVIGDNERGGERPSFQIVSDNDHSGGGGYGGGGSTEPTERVSGHHEFLYFVRVWNDHEPWYKGDPEICCLYALPNGQKGVLQLYNVNEEHHDYYLNKELFRWYKTYGSFYRIAFYEEDSGTEYNISFEGTISISFIDGNDDMGSNLVNWQDPNYAYYETSDLCWKIRYD